MVKEVALLFCALIFMMASKVSSFGSLSEPLSLQLARGLSSTMTHSSEQLFKTEVVISSTQAGFNMSTSLMVWVLPSAGMLRLVVVPYTWFIVAPPSKLNLANAP